MISKLLLKCFKVTQTGGAAEFQFLVTQMTSVIPPFISCDPLFCVRHEVDEEKQLVCFNFLTLPKGLPVLTLFLGLGLFWHVSCYLDPLSGT